MSLLDQKEIDKINMFRKELADHMIPIFGEYTIISDSYVFKPNLSEIAKTLGYSTSHISRLLSPPSIKQQPKPKAYESIIREVKAIARHSMALKSEMSELEKSLAEKDEFIQRIKNSKKPWIVINNPGEILAAIWGSIIGILIILLFLVFFRVDIMRKIDNLRSIFDFDPEKDEIVFSKEGIEIKPIDTLQSLIEINPEKGDKIIFSNGHLKIDKLENDTIALPK